MREVGDGNRADYGVGDSNVSERTAGKSTLSRISKRTGITDNGLIEVTCSILKPAKINLTLNYGADNESERLTQRKKTLDSDIVSTLMSLERQIVVKVTKPKSEGTRNLL